MSLEPKTFNGDLTKPPRALAPLFLDPNFVIWKWIADGKGKFTKPPFCPEYPDRHAANNNPATWAKSSAAVAAVLAGLAHGIGYVLTGTPMAAVDLDDCRDPGTGNIDDWAQNIVDRAPGAYVEVTVSGAGLRVIGTGSGAAAHR
jgi:primase-polymerase (primpol)-like protein